VPDDSQQQHVDCDLSCVSCGYNLRTLSLAGVCPECGQPVFKSIRRGLHEADLNWLRTVRLGATILAWTWVAAGAVGLIGVFGPPHLLGVMYTKWPIIPWAFGCGATLFGYIIGSVLLTKQEPNTRSPRWFSVTSAIRACPGVLTIALLAKYAHFVSYDAALIVPTLILWAGLIDVHTLRLARRGGDRDTARFAAETLWVCPVAYALTALVGWTLLVSVSRSFSDVLDSLKAVVFIEKCAWWLWVGLVGLFNLVLMFGVRTLLSRATAPHETQPSQAADGPLPG